MQTERNPGDRIAELERMGLSLSATFIPFSQSRSKSDKNPSLNWLVTIKKDGREVITTDYMQGSGHAPAYKNPTRFTGTNAQRDEYTTRQRIAKECETGKEWKTLVIGGRPLPLPALDEVMYSLVMDASAIDAGSFADWCAEYGYSDDSISARATYDACVATALKLRAAVGNSGIETLREITEGM